MIGPVFVDHSKNYTNVHFVKVDVDELEDVSGAAGVEGNYLNKTLKCIEKKSNFIWKAMPSFFVYKNGEKVDSLVGASKEALEALIKKYN